MGLLTSGRRARAMTAEKKKGKYVYYRRASDRGACGNAHVREEQLAELLRTVLQQNSDPVGDRREAEDAGFELLLTTDRRIRHQQNLRVRRIALVVLRATARIG